VAFFEAAIAEWNWQRRTVTIQPCLENFGAVEGRDVNIKLLIPETLHVIAYRERPASPKLPRYPETHTFLLNQAYYRGPNLERMTRYNPFVQPTSSGPQLTLMPTNNVQVEYWNRSVRQLDRYDLRPFYLMFSENAPNAFNLEFQIRASNGHGTVAGKILVRLTEMLDDSATFLATNTRGEFVLPTASENPVD